MLTDATPGSETAATDHTRSEEDSESICSPGGKGGGGSLSPDSGNLNGDMTYSPEGERPSITEYDIVRSVLYSSRENINILHECFRQVCFEKYYSDADRLNEMS